MTECLADEVRRYDMDVREIVFVLVVRAFAYGLFVAVVLYFWAFYLYVH